MYVLQLNGYFIKYAAEVGRPPWAFVLSEESAKVMFFPFVNKESKAIVEGVLLEDFPLWVNSSDSQCLNRQLLVLFLVLCAGRESATLQYRYPNGGTLKKDVMEHILTATEKMEEALRQKDEALQQALQQALQKDEALQQAEVTLQQAEVTIQQLRQQMKGLSEPPSKKPCRS